MFFGRRARTLKEALNQPSHRRRNVTPDHDPGPVSSAMIRLDSGFRRNDENLLNQYFVKLNAIVMSPAKPETVSLLDGAGGTAATTSVPPSKSLKPTFSVWF
jgi:hypothetical protein